MQPAALSCCLTHSLPCSCCAATLAASNNRTAVCWWLFSLFFFFFACVCCFCLPDGFLKHSSHQRYAPLRTSYMSCNMQGGAFITPCVLVKAPVMQSLFLFLTEAVSNIVKFLGMQPCERSDKVPDNKNSHTLYLAGELCRHVSAGAAALQGCKELKIRAGACDVLTEPWVGFCLLQV